MTLQDRLASLSAEHGLCPQYFYKYVRFLTGDKDDFALAVPQILDEAAAFVSFDATDPDNPPSWVLRSSRSSETDNAACWETLASFARGLRQAERRLEGTGELLLRVQVLAQYAVGYAARLKVQIAEEMLESAGVIQAVPTKRELTGHAKNPT